MRKRQARVLGWIALVAVTFVAGCAGHRVYRQAQISEQHGEWDKAVLHYLELVDRYPANVTYRAGLLRAKIRASQKHFERGKELHEAGVIERALTEYLQAVQLDPTNQYAKVELDKLRIQAAAANPGSALSLSELKERTEKTRPQPPVLNPRSKAPIDLSFPKPVKVQEIYRALGKAFGINIQFDPKLRDPEISIELQQVTAQDALEVLMRTASHFYKVLNESTIIVADDNPQNRRVYEDLVIQTFFLSNAEVKDVMTMLRSLVGAKNIAANDQLNAIVLRDTADRVKVAEKIINTNDKSRGEVVVEVELLQINTSLMRDLGVSLSEYRITQTLDQDPPLRASDLEFINQGSWILTLPSFIYEFVKNSSEAQLLANPQVRISDGEKATLHIGDRVPIPVTTFNTGQTVGGNIVPITSFQYQEVGIRLDIEPRMHHNKEVSLKVLVEVSNLSGTVEGSGGQQQPIIGTRTFESTIRLQDGETNFLAGLIRNDETNSDVGMPGLADIPVIGRLFSNKATSNQRTDLVLTLTPHIIRTPDVTTEDLMPIWVGTETNITFRGGSPRVDSQEEGPFDEGTDEDDSERIRELIRRRIQNLPRGLDGEAGGESGGDAGATEEDPGPTGIELAPSGAPTDPFGGAGDDADGDVSDLGRMPDFRPASSEGVLDVRLASSRGPMGVGLRPTRRRVGVGERVEVLVEATSAEALSHVPMTLRFSPRLLEVESVDSGDLLGPSGRVAFLWDVSRRGKLEIGASRLGRVPGVSGSGTVARIVFRALREGSARVWFSEVTPLDPERAPLERVPGPALRLEIVPPGEAAPDEPRESAPKGPTDVRGEVDLEV